MAQLILAYVQKGFGASGYDLQFKTIAWMCCHRYLMVCLRF